MKSKPGLIIFVVVLVLIIVSPIVYFLTVPQKKTTVEIYGVEGIGGGLTSLTRTDSAVGMTYKFNGNVVESDFDNVYPWSAMKMVKDANDNVFVKIPKFYSKYTDNGDGTVKLQISNSKLDGFSTLFIDGAGEEIDYVLVGAYEATGSSAQIYSKKGDFPLTKLTIDQFRTASRANGEGYQLYDYLILSIVNQLFTVEFATTDSQSIFYGYASDRYAGAVVVGQTGESEFPSVIFDGGVFKYRGIENIWGNKFKFVDGITFDGVNIYLSTNPEKYVAGNENRNDSYELLSIGRPIDSGVSWGLSVDNSNNALAFINSSGFINDSTIPYHLADYYYVDSDLSGEVLRVGGPVGYTSRAGAWCFYGEIKSTYAGTDTTTRLCYKPVNGFIEV